METPLDGVVNSQNYTVNFRMGKVWKGTAADEAGG